MPFDRELSGDHHILWLEKDRFYRRYIAVTNLEADISTGPEKAIPACHKMWRCASSIRVFESQTFWHDGNPLDGKIKFGILLVSLTKSGPRYSTVG